MTQTDVVKIWLDGAIDALETAEVLLSSKKYNHALFFGQLYLEKLLKATTYHTTDNHPLFTHDLSLLARKSGITISDNQLTQLDEITSFNVSGRYQEHKHAIYQKATPEYTTQWMTNIKELGNYFNSLIK